MGDAAAKERLKNRFTVSTDDNRIGSVFTRCQEDAFCDFSAKGLRVMTPVLIPRRSNGAISQAGLPVTQCGLLLSSA